MGGLRIGERKGLWEDIYHVTVLTVNIYFAKRYIDRVTQKKWGHSGGEIAKGIG